MIKQKHRPLLIIDKEPHMLLDDYISHRSRGDTYFR